MWALRGLSERDGRGELGRAMDVEGPDAAFGPLDPREATRLDIWGTRVTTGPQANTHFRSGLDAHRAVAADRLPSLRDRLVIKVGGMVITRQRPDTAKGFVFLNLEDETDLVNVIVNSAVYERNRRVIRAAYALVIEGTLQKDPGTLDVIARRFWGARNAGGPGGDSCEEFRLAIKARTADLNFDHVRRPRRALYSKFLFAVNRP